MDCLHSIKSYLWPTYSLGERIVRLAVFQLSVSQSGWFERCITRIFSAITQGSCSPEVVNEKRAKNCREAYEALGAVFSTISSKDGEAKLQKMHLRSSDLEAKINELGGEWKKMKVLEETEDGMRIEKSVLVIFPPKEKGGNWDKLEEAFQKLRWKKKTFDYEYSDGSVEVEGFVTCEDAEDLPDQLEEDRKKLFLYMNSPGMSFIMNTRGAAAYLGRKEDICFFDPRGVWKSTGVASEAGLYRDIWSVYKSIRDQYSPQNIWVNTVCGGCMPTWHLMSKVHHLGVNFILESPFTNLHEDFIYPRGYIVRAFVWFFGSGLKSKGKDIGKGKVLETGFDAEKLLQNLSKTNQGKVVLVNIDNDQFLSKKVSDRVCTLVSKIYQNVFQVSYTSQERDPHSDYHLKHEIPTQEVFRRVYQRESA